MATKAFIIPCMSKKKEQNQDRHKPAKMGRVRKPFADLLDSLAERHVTTFTEELNIAVREYLERHNLWPPKPDDKSK